MPTAKQLGPLSPRESFKSRGIGRGRPGETRARVKAGIEDSTFLNGLDSDLWQCVACKGYEATGRHWQKPPTGWLATSRGCYCGNCVETHNQAERHAREVRELADEMRRRRQKIIEDSRKQA